MFELLTRFIDDEGGEDLIEYGLLAAFVASIALVVIISDPTGIRRSVRKVYQQAADVLDGQGPLRRP